MYAQQLKGEQDRGDPMRISNLVNLNYELQESSKVDDETSIKYERRVAPGALGRLFKDDGGWRVDKAHKGVAHNETERWRRESHKAMPEVLLRLFGLRRPEDSNRDFTERYKNLATCLSTTSKNPLRNDNTLSQNQKHEIIARVCVVLFTFFKAMGRTCEDLIRDIDSDEVIEILDAAFLEECKRNPVPLSYFDAAALHPEDLEKVVTGGYAVVTSDETASSSSSRSISSAPPAASRRGRGQAQASGRGHARGRGRGRLERGSRPSRN